MKASQCGPRTKVMNGMAQLGSLGLQKCEDGTPLLGSLRVINLSSLLAVAIPFHMGFAGPKLWAAGPEVTNTVEIPLFQGSPRMKPSCWRT